jgi:peptidoglycan/LPS O-acetylase OafA/YrhL
VEGLGLNYRKDIDGLRAIAVMSVVLCHAFPQWVRGGFIGVDIFFIISGYLISGLIFEDLANQRFSLRKFYERRIARLFPALLLVMFVVLAFGWFILLGSEYKALGKYTFAGSLFAANFIAWRDIGYFVGDAGNKPLLHLWSLGVEEQFYFIWPIALILFLKFNHKFLTLIFIFGLLSFLTSIILINIAPTAAFYSPFSRFYELMIGALVAYLHFYKYLVFKNVNNDLLSILGLMMIGLGLIFIDPTRLFPGFWVLLPVIGSALVIFASPSAWFNRVILSCRPAVWLGLISYPLYLWHWPLLSFARIIEGGVAPREVRILCVLLAILLAWMTYQFIELPIRKRRGLKDAKKLTPIVLGCGIAMGIVCLTGITLFLTNGLPIRTAKLGGMETVTLENFETQKSDPADSQCATDLPKTLKCYPSRLAETTKILLIGDSHGEALIPGLKQALAEIAPSVTLIEQSQRGCSPLWNVETYDNYGITINCRAAFDAVYKWAAADDSVKTVILVSRWARRVDNNHGFGPAEQGSRSNQYRYINNKKESIQSNVFLLSLDRTLTDLAAMDKRVVFMHQVPEFNFYPPFCGKRPIPLENWQYSESVCTIKRSLVDKRQLEYRQVLESIKTNFPNLMTIDPLSVFCNAERCHMRQDSTYLYRDDDHINNNGAYLLGKQIIAQLYP